LRFLEFVPIAVALAFLSLSLLNPRSVFGLPADYVIIMFGALVGSLIIRELIVRRIRKQGAARPAEMSKIRKATQDLISYLCDGIRTSGLSATDYKIRMKRPPEYFGIKITRYSMMSRNYIVVPSVLGATVSKAKTSLKIVSHSIDTEIVSALRGIPADVHVALLLDPKESKSHDKIIKAMKKSRGAGFDASSREIGKEDRLVILDGKSVWRSRDRNWANLKEVSGSESNDLLKRY
jgi:hypothetical protein